MVKINSLYEEEQHDNSNNSIKNKLAPVIITRARIPSRVKDQEAFIYFNNITF